jgi:hypothetical protein
VASINGSICFFYCFQSYGFRGFPDAANYILKLDDRVFKYYSVEVADKLVEDFNWFIEVFELLLTRDKVIIDV